MQFTNDTRSNTANVAKLLALTTVYCAEAGYEDAQWIVDCLLSEPVLQDFVPLFAFFIAEEALLLAARGSDATEKWCQLETCLLLWRPVSTKLADLPRDIRIYAQPGPAEVLREVALVYRHLGEIEKSKMILKRALYHGEKVSIGSRIALFDLAVLEVETGNLETACALLQDLSTRHPVDSAVVSAKLSLLRNALQRLPFTRAELVVNEYWKDRLADLIETLESRYTETRSGVGSRQEANQRSEIESNYRTIEHIQKDLFEAAEKFGENSPETLTLSLQLARLQIDQLLFKDAAQTLKQIEAIGSCLGRVQRRQASKELLQLAQRLRTKQESSTDFSPSLQDVNALLTSIKRLSQDCKYDEADDVALMLTRWLCSRLPDSLRETYDSFADLHDQKTIAFFENLVCRKRRYEDDLCELVINFLNVRHYHEVSWLLSAVAACTGSYEAWFSSPKSDRDLKNQETHYPAADRLDDVPNQPAARSTLLSGDTEWQDFSPDLNSPQCNLQKVISTAYFQQKMPHLGLYYQRRRIEAEEKRVNEKQVETPQLLIEALRHHAKSLQEHGQTIEARRVDVRADDLQKGIGNSA